jgi:copper transport protein
MALLARVALLLLLVRLPRRPLPAVHAPLAVGLALTWAAAEHASAGIQVPVAMTSSVLHLLATAAWLGGLAALLTSLRHGTLPADTVHRFSRLAFTSVTVLAVTGTYQSWRGLGSLDALTQTSYGRLLLAKLAGVALLLAAAGVSRRLIRVPAGTMAVRERVPEPVGGPLPAPEPEPEPVSGLAPEPESPVDRRRLRRSVLVEVAVGVAVLLLTTLLTGTLPGRAATEAAAAGPTAALPPTTTTTVPFDVGTPGGSGKVQITLDPARTGENSVQAVVFGADGGVAIVPELRLSFTLPAQDIGPIDAEVTDRGGYWATDTLDLPVPGTWTMRTTVRLSDFDQVTVARQVRIS